ncbi:MAG TPA: hypothetical protein DIU00_08765 [Phycisphaerales bacterium]|nr:hypothetical protein [Phycisphaerales bacterium]
MNCPACGVPMVEEDFGSVSVDVCKNGCKGIWFDWGELKDLDESHEGLGKALEEALKNPRAKDTDRGPLKCPKCGLEMRSHKYKSAKQVNVDECYACGGFFLDSGELGQIRDNYMSEEERDAYVQRLIEETPLRDDTHKAKLRAAGCHALGSLFSRRWPFVWP